MQVLDRFDNFSNKLCGDSLGESTLSLQSRVDLPLRSEFKDQVERIIVLVMVEELDYILVVQFIHDLDFKLDLLDKVVLYDLCLVDHLDRIDVLTCLMTNFVNLSEATDADIRVSKRLKVVLAALALLAVRHTGRKEQNSALDIIDFATQLRWHLNRCWLILHTEFV